MKRALRILIMGPLVVFMVALMTIAYPLHRFVWWLTEDRPYDGGGVRELWKEAVGGLW